MFAAPYLILGVSGRIKLVLKLSAKPRASVAGGVLILIFFIEGSSTAG
jgi:hypothetical protein